MEIVQVTGSDLRALLDEFHVTPVADTYSVRFSVQRGGIMVKINGGMWTTPLGVLEVSASYVYSVPAGPGSDEGRTTWQRQAFQPVARRVSYTDEWRRRAQADRETFDYVYPAAPGNPDARLAWLMADEAPAHIIESFESYAEQWQRIATAARLADAAQYRRLHPRAAYDHAEPIGPEDSGERFELNAGRKS